MSLTTLDDVRTTAQVESLIRGLVEPLVKHPECLWIESRPQAPQYSRLVVHLATSDLKRVVGRGGHRAESLRVILAAVSLNVYHRFALEIVRDPQ